MIALNTPHLDPTGWLELTWVDTSTLGAYEVRHVSYHQTQIDQLRADAAAMGTPLDEHEALLAQWVAAYVPPAQPPHADLVALALAGARRERLPIIGILDGLQASALATGDSAAAVSIETSKQALRDITLTDLSACVTYEDMRQAIKLAYAAIVAGASPAVITAFREVV